MNSARQGIFNVIVGLIISLFNALMQFLTIYFVLQKYGSEFNGFVRLVSSFSAIFSTADSAIGVAMVLLLVRPIMHYDWITANEIFSTAVRKYRKGAWTSLIIVCSISFLYPIYAGVGGLSGIFKGSSWKQVGIFSTGTNSSFIPYIQLVAVSLILCFKNFAFAFFFAPYEGIISADNRTVVKRLATLFVDSLVYGIIFWLLNVNTINPIICFLSILIYSPLRGFMTFIYAKKKYPWLKYHREYNNFKLGNTSMKISLSQIGGNLLMNTDIAVAAILLGLNVSSNLSLYLVIGVNVRLVMLNFITSFKEYFMTIIVKNGRVFWKSYTKYELYTYLVAGFAFINITLSGPYFVSALYGKIAYQANEKILNGEAVIAASNLIFKSFVFSGLFGFITALTLMCEMQITLIQAKGNQYEISKFDNINGITYLVFVVITTITINSFKIGGVDYLKIDILMLYVTKSIFLLVRYFFLWYYVWRFVTYNSNFSSFISNHLNILLTGLTTIIVCIFIYNNHFPVTKMTLDNASAAKLFLLFAVTLICSGIFLFLISLIFEWKVFIELMKNIFSKNKKFIVPTGNENGLAKVEENILVNEEIILAGGQIIDKESDNDITINKPDLVYKIKG